MSEPVNEQQNKMKPSRRKYILAAGIVVLLIISALIFSFFEGEAKPDPASVALIREVVAKQLNKDPNDLTDEDFAKITEFTFAEKAQIRMLGAIQATIRYRPRELSDLKLFEKFTNLEILNLNNVKYSEKNIPKWMKIFAKLGIYDISGKFVIDLEPLKNLTSLREISLRSVPIDNIEPLSNLTNLESLYLNGTDVSDIEPLSNLVNIRTLSLNQTKISNLEPLKNLKNLEKLTIYGCENITAEMVVDLKKSLPKAKVERL